MKKFTSKSTLDRRDFLKTVSKTGMSLGFLKASTFATGMMLGRTATAQQTSNIKRVVCFYIGNGAPVNGNNLWLPSNSLNLPVTTAPLENVKDQCVFLSNAVIADKNGSQNGGHGNTSKAFGGAGFSNTYDIELEKTIGATSPFASLQLGVQSNGHGSATKVGNSEIVYQDNPIAAFNRIFNSDVDTSDLATQQSQTVLDIHKEELAILQNVLGSAEKERLEQHLESVSRLEQRLQDQANGQVIAGCSNPVWNPTNYSYDSTNKTRFTTEAQLQLDTAVLALKCNMTNVVSIMLGNHQSEHAISSLNYTGDYHQSIHGGNEQSFGETRAYLSSQLAYFIEELRSATDDQGNSLLDSTLVIQSTDMGDGNSHSSTRAPIMLAGGGSSIQRGRVVEGGDTHHNIFDTVTEVLGLTGQLPQYGQGPLTGIIV